ncbi:MAG: hypothetical protein M3Q58_03645 [Bacteroidota bacterium]|nr:hypothetical protein [Bacteroidota bacterium]
MIKVNKKSVGGESSKSLDIHYIKNPLYRQIYVDGAIGGITAKGKLNINFYAERIVIPKSEEYALQENGDLSDRINISTDSKSGITREIEFGTYMDIDTAKELQKWLDLKIQEFESLIRK